ncbi:Sec23-binding domain of Sec16-domain-containing protein [Rhizophagus clarus]|uniref:Protein transport protein sec16 n=1 Tax=Rhizophagus clarus TaxID=94130 RepID=A0A8H3LNG8_9GLOM|nr:Sec23-binding domain of Sec16-domain-containing protein [Rhizophagus clarus]
MEGSTLNKDQKIAGSAAALFDDSSSPFDAFFASDTFQTSTQQDNQSAASFFDSLANEQPSQTHQTTKDYPSYYEYNRNSSTIQENTYNTIATTTGAQHYNSTTGYDYNNYYGGQYVSANTNGVTEGMNSSIDPQSTVAQYQYSDYGYNYDASYINGQVYSQYNYSQQQQYYDPNDPYAYYYYHDPAYSQNHAQSSINVEQQQNSFQGLLDQANSNQYKEQKEDKSTYNESKQYADDVLRPNAEPGDAPPESSITDVNNFNIDNKNQEFFSDSGKEEREGGEERDSDEENKVMSREIEYSTKKKSIDIVQEQLAITSSNNATSVNNEDAAAVALVETIETNQESVTLTSSKVENDSFIEKDDELNVLENEDQEVNIIHGDDHDIFEYQPHELENHLKSELSQVEPFVSSLTKESKITSEISDANDIEEINSNSKEEQTKLDDLDDLVLGSTSKSGASEVLSYTEFENVANPQERYSISAQDSNSTTLNSSYQYDYSDQDHQYNGQWVSNNVSYQYQENDANRIMGDTTTKSEQVGYKYRGNDTVQTTKNIVNYHYEPATVDNINYQYDSGQMTVENSSAIYQNNDRNSAYVANQSTAVDATIYQGYDTSINTTAEQEQSDYQYQANQTTINKDATLQENYHYTKYDTNQINSTDQTNYHYQEYETSKLDTKTGTDQSNYQYYQGYQPITASSPQNSPPPMSPSSKRLSLISCSDPQCGGENKATAKFCSDCGNPINITMNSKTPAMDISEVIGNTNPYNNLNAYSNQSLPYSHSQASYSTSSFTSYGNQLTSMNDAQYGTGVVLDTHQLDQQQYYGSDDMNDPLGRSKGCRPIVAFGFGGKIYTMFPRTVQRFTSPEHSTPITKSAPGAFTIRVLKDIIPVSDIDDFPGPLLMDNNRGGVKAKKKDVLKFLNDQIHVSENNISSFNEEEVEKRKLESILIVWNLFKIMFENEGVLIGSPKVEDLVRKILVPSASKSNNDEANFTVPADTGFDSQIGLSQTPETSSLTYSVSVKSVDKLQEILLEGDRIAAIRHAMNENLWAHALIIASCVNKDLWKEVVTGFIRQDLMGKVETSEPDGRESLRVLYSLFAGQGQNAVKEFLPYNNLLTVAQSPVTAMIPTSHYSPNTNAPYVTSKVTALYTSSDHSVPLDSLIKWRETIAMILANRAPGDNQAISALGDMLKEYGWIHASHVCYILSPNASIISGFDAPNARFTLLGNDYTQNLPINNFYNWQSLRMTEIYEFGLSLNNNNSGLPHLQAYKLLYAWWLADCGYLNEARRYCESIANIVKVYTKGSPYFHGCFLQKLKDLTQRLLEHGGGTNESSSWLFAKKMPKATLDSLWGSLEGKFNKFVAGDVVDENVRKSSSSNASETIGPFSHFSSITHPTSEVPSRSVSASDFRTIPNPTVDTRRATTPNAVVQKHLNGNQRRSSTPGVGLVNGGYNDNFSPTISDGQNTMSSVLERESLDTSPIDDKNGYYGHFKRQDQQYSSSYGYSSYKQYDNNQQSVTDNGANSNEQQPYTSSSDYSGVEGNKKNQQTMFPYYQPSETTYKNDSAWWNNPNSDSTNIIEDQKADQTQTDDIGEGEGEFISLMDSNFTPFVPAPAPAPATSTTVTSNQNNNWDDDYDDLGLGNNSFSKGKNIQATDSATGTNNNNNETKHDISQTEQKKEEKQDEQKAEEKKGWFERWFGKREGGKAANLGEESSFYYDPVQKRWINKKAGSEPNNTLMPPPPPPQRSKTTSPQPSYSMMSSNPNRQSLPPMDNKNQTGLPNSATPPPPPPPNKGGRASSASMKRGVRRYVDIMNQPSPN